MPEDKKSEIVEDQEPIPVVIVETQTITITEKEKVKIVENQEPIPIVIAEVEKKGFFSKERIQSRWKKIFKFLWPIIEESVKSAIKSEVSDQLDSRDKTKAQPRGKIIQ